MRNKRGVFMAIYLVVLTLFLCGVVIFLYNIEQKNSLNSLVSPKVVMDIEDGLEVYEMREVALIEESVGLASGTFPEKAFRDSFRSGFLTRVKNDLRMKEFIFRNLTVGDVLVREGDKVDLLFDNTLYPESGMREEGGKLIIERASIGKRLVLNAEDKKKINFPVDFAFEFEKEYLISFEGGKFEVEVA